MTGASAKRYAYIAMKGIPVSSSCFQHSNYPLGIVPTQILRHTQAMNYTLVASDRSPFGRVCRIFMLANRIEFKFESLNFVDDEKAAAVLAKETPINKVPYLIAGKDKVFYPNDRGHWNYPAMSLYACLEWGERRAQMLSIEDHPDLADFLRKFTQAPGVQATGFTT